MQSFLKAEFTQLACDWPSIKCSASKEITQNATNKYMANMLRIYHLVNVNPHTNSANFITIKPQSFMAIKRNEIKPYISLLPNLG